MDLQMKNMCIAVKNALHNTADTLENPDFDLIFEYASRQSLLPVVYEGCSRDRAFGTYKSSQQLMNRIFSVLSVQAQRTDAFEELYGKLIEGGVKPLVLKGLLCRSTYGELCDHRSSGDEDIMILPEDFQKAKVILADNGYVLEDEYVAEENLSKIQELSYINPEKRLRIELHFNFFSDSNDKLKIINRYFENKFDDAVTFQVNGKNYYTLEYTKNYIYLFFHIYKHFISSGVGLRPMMDLFMFEKAYGEHIDRDTVEKAIRDISAWKLYGDIIAIGNRYLGFDFKNRSAVTDPEMLIDDIQNAGTFGIESEALARSSLFTTTAVSHKGIKRYIRFVFPELSYMQGHYPILCDKPKLLPLYWVRRLAYGVVFLLRKGKDGEKDNQFSGKRIKLLKKYKMTE